MNNINREDLRHPEKPLLGVAGVLLRSFGIYAVGAALTILFARFVLKTDFSDLNSFLAGPADKDQKQTLLQLLQGFSHFMQFILLPLLYIMFYNKSLFSIFFPDLRKSVVFTIMGFFMFFTFLPVLQYLAQFNQSIDLPASMDLLEKKIMAMEEVGKKGTLFLIEYDSRQEFLICMLVIAVLPAVGEELFFRGIIQNELQYITRNPHVAIWFAAFIFSFFHFQFYGFIPRLLLGVFFGYMYFWSGNILIPMLLHFANNAGTLILMHRFGHKFEELERANVQKTPAMFLVVSIGLTAVMVYYCIRFYKERIEDHESQ
jgi:uncharacterized protein